MQSIIDINSYVNNNAIIQISLFYSHIDLQMQTDLYKNFETKSLRMSIKKKIKIIQQTFTITHVEATF